MGYDHLNRRVNDANGASLAYDNFGNLTSAYLGGITSTRGYNALSQKISEQSAGLPPVSFTYDAAGRRHMIAWAGAGSNPATTITYLRNSEGQVTDIVENSAATVAHYAYDQVSRLQTLNYGNGTWQSYTYDGAWRPWQLGLAVNSSIPGSITLQYNAASQINTRTDGNPAYVWGGAYAVSRGYQYNGLNQLTQSGGYTISHDANGNLTNDGDHGYGYSPTNQLTSFSTAAAGASLTYDGLSRLAMVSPTTSAATQFDYDDNELLDEYDASGNLLRRYVPGPDGGDDQFLWYERSSPTGPWTRRYMHRDEQGSVVAVTNDNWVVQNGFPNTYDEYGVPGIQNLGRLQYTGQMWLPEVGLYYYKARVYSPTLGRFLQSDPIGYASDMNMYAYVGGDPVNGIDPSGMQCDTIPTRDDLSQDGRQDGSPSSTGCGGGGDGGGIPNYGDSGAQITFGNGGNTGGVTALAGLLIQAAYRTPALGPQSPANRQPANPQRSACIQAAIGDNAAGILLDLGGLGLVFVDAIPAAGVALVTGAASMVNSAAHGDLAGVGIGATGYHLTAFSPLVGQVGSSGGKLLLKGAGAAVGGIGLVRDTQVAMKAIDACYAKYP